VSASAAMRLSIKARVGRLVIDVELESGPGPLVVIGPNGAGKTSLLSLILGVLRVDCGYVEIGGTVVLDTSRSTDVPLEHRRIGYVPQDYALFPHRTARGNIEFAAGSAQPRARRVANLHRAEQLLAELGLLAQADQRVQTLSGGEKQRVALARALSVNPRALLLDEPLSALDFHSRRKVREFLASYLRRLAFPTLVVTHDPTDAQQLGQHIVVLEDGRITQIGSWEELAARPASKFVEQFVTTTPETRSTSRIRTAKEG
jgi:molybdate transport system ATP-binding protein